MAALDSSPQLRLDTLKLYVHHKRFPFDNITIYDGLDIVIFFNGPNGICR